MIDDESRNLINEILIEQIKKIEEQIKKPIEDPIEKPIEEQIEEPIKKIEKPSIKRKKIENLPFTPISNIQYHYVINCIRLYFIEKGLIECCLQQKFPILSSCDESFKHTHQFLLEYELLQNDKISGYFCVNNSNIEHTNSIPTVEFVINGDIHVLESFIQHLLVYLCYNNISEYTIKDYSYITNKLNANVNYLSNTVKQKIYTKFGPVFLLKNYPFNTAVHWTIKGNITDNTYNKLVTILSGYESITSYEISSDKNDMLNQFNSMSYNTHLGNTEDVNEELNQYLSQLFVTRSYGKMFILEIITSMIKERLIPDCFM